MAKRVCLHQITQVLRLPSELVLWQSAGLFHLNTRALTSLVKGIKYRIGTAFVLNRLSHAGSRDVVVIALTAEGISAALRRAVGANRPSAVTALRHGSLAAWASQRRHLALKGWGNRIDLAVKF
jgi:hypothetical protein